MLSMWEKQMLAMMRCYRKHRNMTGIKRQCDRKRMWELGPPILQMEVWNAAAISDNCWQLTEGYPKSHQKASDSTSSHMAKRSEM